MKLNGIKGQDFPVPQVGTKVLKEALLSYFHVNGYGYDKKGIISKEFFVYRDKGDMKVEEHFEKMQCSICGIYSGIE